tara:strand:- start:1111 stop:1779 length:669 start_codon:yes stop_codon:yes gene_type:complete
MVYLKLHSNQLNTLKTLPNKLNDCLVSNNIGGIICLNKANEIKQIIFDFEAYNVDELFISSKDKKVHLLKHIKNPNPKKYYVLSFEIENVLKKSSQKEEYNCFSSPDIFQWIKCVIFSIYRHIFNHLVFTTSHNIYIISMKKNYFSSLYRYKHHNNITIKDMYHKLMKDYLDIFHYHKNIKRSSYTIPDKFNEFFIIQKFDVNKNVLFSYTTFSCNNIIAKS